MASFTEFMVAVLLILGAILLVFSIIICIKLLYTVDKVNVILTDMEEKLKSVNGVFKTMNVVSDTICSTMDLFLGRVVTFIDKTFKKKK